MLAHTIFVQLQSLVVISTHADRQSVDMSITVCLFVYLFVNLSLCVVTDFSTEDKASGVKFCTMVHGRPGYGISHFGELCSLRSPKSDESARGGKHCRMLIDASPLLTARSPSIEGTRGLASIGNICPRHVWIYPPPEDGRICLFVILCFYGYGFLRRG